MSGTGLSTVGLFNRSFTYLPTYCSVQFVTGAGEYWRGPVTDDRGDERHYIRDSSPRQDSRPMTQGSMFDGPGQWMCDGDRGWADDRRPLFGRERSSSPPWSGRLPFDDDWCPAIDHSEE